MAYVAPSAFQFLGNEKKEDASKYISIKREDGRSALDVASQMGHIEIMKLLHEEGKKDSESCPSAVPLHLAAISGHYEAVQLLLSFGIPVNARNKERRTALHE